MFSNERVSNFFKLPISSGRQTENDKNSNKHLIVYLLVTSADNLSNSWDPDQAQQNVGFDMDPNCLSLMVFLNFFPEIVDFVKQSADER